MNAAAGCFGYRACMRHQAGRHVEQGILTICSTSMADSSGFPRRWGKGTAFPRDSRTISGIPRSIRVSAPRGYGHDPDAQEASSRARGRVRLTTPPLEAL